MDSRFHLKAEFEIYGEKYEWKCSLNWSAYQSNEIDQRITDWFLDCHDKAYAKWQYEMESHRQAENAESQRRAELEQLKRLREKYPNESCAS